MFEISWLSCVCLESVKRMSGGCLEDVWMVSRGFLKVVWMVSGGFYLECPSGVSVSG